VARLSGAPGGSCAAAQGAGVGVPAGGRTLAALDGMSAAAQRRLGGSAAARLGGSAAARQWLGNGSAAAWRRRGGGAAAARRQLGCGLEGVTGAAGPEPLWTGGSGSDGLRVQGEAGAGAGPLRRGTGRLLSHPAWG